MRIKTGIVIAAGLLFSVPLAPAQPPGGGRGGATRADDVESFVAKMLAFDKNKDGKLTRDEISDQRLVRLFDRADTNKDGVVTREELVALFQRENQGGGPGDDGPGGGGPGGPGGGGPGGRGRGGPQPGQVFPMFMADQLNLTDAQKKQIADVQKEVDAQLDKILSAEQKARLKEMRDRGPGGPGGNRGGPGGPPPQ